MVGNERIIDTYIEDEMKGSYIDYAMSVIVGRALPDARDGLKPVHRRILYAMNSIGLGPGKPYKKSASVVGEVLAKYHPHGDSAVYDTMVRMAQDFSLRYPLVDGQGNFGSIDGDSAAAYRYTEARLEKISLELLNDIDKETVDFVPNFDESTKEPVVLPSLLPNLLLNGSSGIAVGMATNIPPHNLNELCSAVIELIDNPKVTIKELMKHVKAPDFPTGAIIYGRSRLEEIYTTGRGSLTLRSRASIETGKSGRDSIIISEIPYQVNKTTIIERIAQLVRDKKIEGIADLRDESDRTGMRFVIELRKTAPAPKIILNKLFKHTQLQSTFGVIMLALVDGIPRVLNLKAMLDCYLQHRVSVVTRRTQYDLRKAEERAHILEGLRVAVANIDEVIRIIKKAKDPETARVQLMKKFKLSDIQARAILAMQLQRLTGLEVKKIEEEYSGLMKRIKELKSILASKKKLMGIIRREIEQIKETYGDARRTDIIDEEGEFTIEDLIADENVVITISHSGYIKRIPETTYRRQGRGGRGVTGGKLKDEDFVEHIFMARTHSYILVFTDKGHCYWLKVYDIPEGSRTSRGKAIVNLLSMATSDKISAIVPIRTFEEGFYLMMVTRSGTIKKTDLMAFSNPRRNGIKAINLDAKDQLVEVLMTCGNDEVVIASKGGQAIRFHEDEIRAMGRSSRGVRGMRLGDEDDVVGMVKVHPHSELLTATENGFGKRTELTAYRVTRRGGKGVINIKTSDRNGKVVAVKEVMPGDELIIISQKGIVIRQAVEDIRSVGRTAQGVRLIKLGAGDQIGDIARVVGDRREKEATEAAAAAAADAAPAVPEEKPAAAQAAAADDGGVPIFVKKTATGRKTPKKKITIKKLPTRKATAKKKAAPAKKTPVKKAAPPKKKAVRKGKKK